MRIPHLRRRLREIHERRGAPRAGSVRSLELVVEETIDPGSPPADAFAPGFVARIPREDDERLLFFDLETMGLARSSEIFMAGYLFWDGGRLRLVQEVASHVAEERLLIQSAIRRMAVRPRVVTYNGGSYDLPLLWRRCKFHALPCIAEQLDPVDLLHRARRRYRGRLDDFRLSTVERGIVGRGRDTRDVPGFEAPIRFMDFCRTGDRACIDPVLYHNRIDLTTLVSLYDDLVVKEEKEERES